MSPMTSAVVTAIVLLLLLPQSSYSYSIFSEENNTTIDYRNHYNKHPAPPAPAPVPLAPAPAPPAPTPAPAPTTPATAQLAPTPPARALTTPVPMTPAPSGPAPTTPANLPQADIDLLEFPLNLEFLEAEFFLFGSLGYGLDKVNPSLTHGGPPPTGARLARLDRLTRDIISQFAFQEVGHLRAIQKIVNGFPRPQLDLSARTFAKVMNKALGKTLYPPFDPYANAINFLLASYLIPYVGLTGYVGANPLLQVNKSRRLVAGLLGVESGQDAIIRGMLYERAAMWVVPYRIRVGEFTNRISDLRNKLGGRGVKDEGLFVQKQLGPEGKSVGNVLAGDADSLAYGRNPVEILRIVYGSGNEAIPGGFFPKGANGRISQSHLIRK